MASLARTRSGINFSGDEMPLLPLSRKAAGKGEKGEVKEVTFKAASFALYQLLAEVPKSYKTHQLFARLLQWSHGFDPDDRDTVDQVLACYMHDYNEAMTKHAAAFDVARKMLKYQLPITEDGDELVARDTKLKEVCADFPHKSKRAGGGSDKVGKKSEPKKGAARA